jgi:hypothetical protein
VDIRHRNRRAYWDRQSIENRSARYNQTNAAKCERESPFGRSGRRHSALARDLSTVLDAANSISVKCCGAPNIPIAARISSICLVGMRT